MLGPNRHLLKLRASTLVVAISCWWFACLRRRLFHARVTYGLMFQRDIERQTNLRFIYESDDIQCVELLRMSKVPFFELNLWFVSVSTLAKG
jgi:hypothetical protein